MTVSSVPTSYVMCSETNVTLTSIQIHSRTSSVDGSKEPATDQHVNLSARSETDVTLTSLHVHRTTSTSDGVGDSEGSQDQHVNSVSARMEGSPKVVTFDNTALDINEIEKLCKIPANANSCSIEDCAKLVFQLSRELALLHGLSRGIGNDTDSDKLREELRLSRHRICTLAQQNGASLIPLFRSKTGLKKEETAEVEKLYRIYSGCLEYLLYLLCKVKSLFAIFHLNQETCLLIQTGITDPVGFVHKSSCTQKEAFTTQSSGETSASCRPAQPHDDLTRLARDIKIMQHLLYIVNSACDIPPWDVQDEAQNDLKQRKSSVKPSRSQSRKSMKRVRSTDGEGGILADRGLRSREASFTELDSDSPNGPEQPTRKSTSTQFSTNSTDSSKEPTKEVSSTQLGGNPPDSSSPDPDNPASCCSLRRLFCGYRQEVKQGPKSQVRILINDCPDNVI